MWQTTKFRKSLQSSSVLRQVLFRSNLLQRIKHVYHLLEKSSCRYRKGQIGLGSSFLRLPRVSAHTWKSDTGYLEATSAVELRMRKKKKKKRDHRRIFNGKRSLLWQGKRDDFLQYISHFLSDLSFFTFFSSLTLFIYLLTLNLLPKSNLEKDTRCNSSSLLHYSWESWQWLVWSLLKPA